MSDMLKRFEESKAPRPSAAKQIPNVGVNFFDQTNEWSENFTPGEKPGDPTKFTEKALNNFEAEKKNIVTNASFLPVEPGVKLHRWGPDKKYYNPGQGK